MTVLLPPNATRFERALESAMARMGDVATPIETVWRPSSIRADLLPYLAHGLSVDGWLPEWPEAVKRERTRRAIEIQRTKGSVASVRAVVAALGGSIALREWWQEAPLSDPYTFKLILSLTPGAGDAPSPGYIDSIIDEVRRTKPVRSHFTFTLALTGKGSIGQIAAARPAVYARLATVAPAI